MPARSKVSYVDDALSVGRRLRLAREEAGISQRALSFPGCTAAHISKIESGNRIPSLQVLRELATRIGVDEAYLARGQRALAPQSQNAVLVRLAIRLGDFDVARHLVREMLDALSSPRERAIAYALQGEIGLAEGDLAAAHSAFAEAVSLDEQLEGREPDTAEALGRLHLQSHDRESAITVFQRNLERATATDDRINQLRFASLLASALIDCGRSESAEAVLADALGTPDSSRDPLSFVRRYWTRAQQPDSEAATRAITQAVTLLATADQQCHQRRITQLLAHLELNRGNHARAAALLEQATPALVAGGRSLELASFHVDRARALFLANRYEEARSAAHEAAPLVASHSGPEAIRSASHLADVFGALGDDEHAIAFYELAITLGEEQNNHTTQVYASLASIHERRGNKAATLETLRRGFKPALRTT